MLICYNSIDNTYIIKLINILSRKPRLIFQSKLYYLVPPRLCFHWERVGEIKQNLELFAIVWLKWNFSTCCRRLQVNTLEIYTLTVRFLLLVLSPQVKNLAVVSQGTL